MTVATQTPTAHRIPRPPELLPGDEEARLSFEGAVAGLDPAAGPFLVVDIGGGSTELILGDQHLSLDVG